MGSFNLKIDSIKDDMIKTEIVLDALRFHKLCKETNNPFLLMQNVDDKKNANVLFVNYYINDWPKLFLITKKKIRANEPFSIFYDDAFRDCVKERNHKNQRLVDIQ